MQIKIPQEVDVADKILGPLTMKSFIIIMVGGGIGYVFFTILDDQTWPFIVIPELLLTLAIVFVKVKGMSFTEYISNLALFTLKPQVRTWIAHSGDLDITDREMSKIKEGEATLVKANSGNDEVVSKRTVMPDRESFGNLLHDLDELSLDK